MSFLNQSTTIVGTTAAETMNVTAKTIKKKDPMDDIDPNAAPLEQNIKNHFCDGIKYQVVKEDPALLKPHEINRFAISPSRKAEIRRLERANTQTLTAKQKLAGKRKSMKVTDTSCFALVAGDNAALEEVQAEERDIRREQHNAEFYSKIKRAVDRRAQVQSATTRNQHLMHAE